VKETLTLVAGRHLFRGTFQGLAREASICIPSRLKITPDTGQRVAFLALDGAIKRHESPDRMVSDFGFQRIADEYGVIVVNPQALSPRRHMQWAGVRSWNTPGALARYDRSYDDVTFIQTLVEDLTEKLGVGAWYGAGFSAGAQFLHVLTARCPGMLKGVVSVGGTILGTESSPSPGTHLIVFHGDRDPRLPHRGGWSKGLKRRLTTLYAIGPKIRWSKPWRQVVEYARANGLDPGVVVRETIKDFILRTKIDAEDLMIVEYLLSAEFGYHDWHADHINALFMRDLGLHQLVAA
jgi:poly(3-hydroxybutyrate) depolymerase